MLAVAVMIVSAGAFLWVEFYSERNITPLLKSVSIQSNCTNDEGFLGFVVRQSDPSEVEFDAGLVGPVACSDIQIRVPTVGSDVLSVVPHGRQPLTDQDFSLSYDDVHGSVIALHPDRMPVPSGYVTFLAPMTRTSFDKFSILLPINMDESQGALRPPKSISFSAMIGDQYELATLRPADLTVTEKVPGSHMLTYKVTKSQEIYVEVISTKLRRWKNAVEWSAAAFFAAAITYLLALAGLRV
jgi:hypothetical protein